MKKYVILFCLAIAACAVEQVNNLDLNGAMNPRPRNNPTITIITEGNNQGVKMPDITTTEVELCAKDEDCVAHIK